MLDVQELKSPEQGVIEVLERQLSMVNEEKRQLLELIMAKQDETPPAPPSAEFKPIMPKQIPWHVRRQMLEAEDREKAKLEKEKSKEQEEINKLEKELEITSNAPEHKSN